MLKHLPQLVKFKTAMDVRIGFPNEHLAGSSREEINQPMFSTSVGLIMRGLDYLETYKSSFNAGENLKCPKKKRKALKERGLKPKQDPSTKQMGKSAGRRKSKKASAKCLKRRTRI